MGSRQVALKDYLAQSSVHPKRMSVSDYLKCYPVGSFEYQVH